MPTIKDIAEFTGLSTATVSRCLNRHPYVSREAQLAIELAVRELGYRPNSAARSLRSGRTGRVGVVVPDASHPFFAALVAGAGQAAAAEGFDLLLQQTETGEWHADRLLEPVITAGVDGLLVASELTPWEQYAAALSGFPVVTCDQALAEIDLPAVYVDHYESTLEGLAHLRDRDSRSIVGISSTSPAASCDRLRRAAYREFALGNQGVTVHELYIDADTPEAGSQLFPKLMALEPRPDAVFTGSDDIAAGLLVAARENGVDVPARLKIIGFDDSPIARVLRLTTVRQPVRRMGARAFTLLRQLMHTSPSSPSPRAIADRPSGVQRVRVRYKLIARETT